MNSTLRLQKTFYILYFIISILTFVFALSFMTDFQELYGFQLPKNQGIIEYYSNQLQPFNRTILNFSLALVVGLVFMLVFEVLKKVTNFTGLCFGSALSIYTIINCVLFIFRLNTLKANATKVDLSNGYLEDLPSDFVMLTRTFDIGFILYLVVIVISIAFIILLFINFFLYLKKNQGVKVYFIELKKRLRGVFKHEN